MVKKKFVQPVQSKGKTYYYFRRGSVRKKLPDNPDSPEFDRAYWDLRSGSSGYNAKTTFSVLIDSYYKTPRFQRLKPNTQKGYMATMELIREKNGNKDFTRLTRKGVIAARDKYAPTWRKANAMVECLSFLAKHAIDLEWITANPAQGVEKLKGGSYEAWPDAMLRAYERYCDENDLQLERTVYELCTGTGQRIGDVCNMTWDQFTDDGYMKVIQEKTGQFVEVYCPQRLQDYLAQLPKTGRHILAKNLTQPTSKRRVQTLVQVVREAIGAEKYVIHGWRYNAAKELAEAGCSDAQIQAVTGHRTLEMAQKYRSQAERKQLSKDAQTRRERNKKV